MELCKHVDIEEADGVLWVSLGLATPFYGWSPELQADIPRLRCSECGATATLPGPGVGRAANRIDGMDLI